MSARSPFLRQLTVSALLFVGIVAGKQMVDAQSTPATEKISLPLGSVFEVLAQEGAPQTQYAWVLSYERTFLQAGRGRSLRTRFAQPGRYLLSAEVAPPGGKSIRQSFAITVVSGTEDLSGSGTALETVPGNLNGAIVVTEEQRLVSIRPTPGMLADITLDADLSVDEDADGNAENDRSAEGTYLISDGLPLFLWITSDLPASFAVSGTNEDGSPLLRQFTVSLASAPVAPPAPVPESQPLTGGIEVTEEEDGSLRFSILDRPPMQTPVVPIWDFGDGTQSMLMEPVHRFTQSGTYVVRARLKDLRNGIDIRDLAEEVTVQSPEISAPVPTTKKPPADEIPSKGSSRLAMILKILMGLIMVAMTGGVITVVTLKLRKGKSLAERLEAADKKMAIPKPEAGSTTAPMSLPDSPEVIDAEAEKTAPPAATLPAPAGAGPVPDWLQNVPKTPKATPSTMPVAPPAPATPSAPVAPATPIPVRTKESEPLLSENSMPDWLTPNAEKKDAQSVIPAPAKATPSPVPAAVPQPATPQKLETPSPAPVATAIPVLISPKAETSTPSAGRPLPAWLQPNTGTSMPPPTPAPATSPNLAPAPVKAEPKSPVVAPPNTSPQPQIIVKKNNIPPPEPKPQIDPISEEKAQEVSGALPAWLQPQTTPKEVPPAPMLETSKPAPTPVTLVQPKNPPVPAPVKTPEPKPELQTNTTTPATSVPPPPPAAPKVLSEKERERRRLKRQRYRQNKQHREAAAGTPSADPSTLQTPKPASIALSPDEAPVAFIRAESIENNPPFAPEGATAGKPNPTPDIPQ
ncbi:MAG: hypothetical protein Greene101449_290 [Candidatus Peregrinibacteria bacterium Greene1014_49]|nr:MAG: hypothetical protein Greene101449_290 [Candidatus Peregrinibacteria bacterium Greene1014_49]